jgi:hypothetical protein
MKLDLMPTWRSRVYVAGTVIQGQPGGRGENVTKILEQQLGRYLRP